MTSEENVLTSVFFDFLDPIEEFHNAPQTYTHNKSQSIIIITEPIIMGIQKAIVGWFAQFNRYRFSLYELTIA